MRTIQNAVALAVAAAAVLAPAAAAATTAAAGGTAAANARASDISVASQPGTGTVPAINGNAARSVALDNLFGVSCVNGSFCMAVGSFVRSGNDVVLAEA